VGNRGVGEKRDKKKKKKGKKKKEPFVVLPYCQNQSDAPSHALRISRFVGIRTVEGAEKRGRGKKEKEKERKRNGNSKTCSNKAESFIVIQL